MIEQDEPTKLHIEAMSIYEGALALRKQGQQDRSLAQIREALELELQVVNMVKVLPAKLILLKSAAVLAHEGSLPELAYTLCGEVLRETSTPWFIRDEILSLLQDIKFEERHLRLSDLKPAEVEFSLVGPGIAHGVAPVDQVLNRIENLNSLVTRTAEFSANLEYRGSGQPSKSSPVQEHYMHVPVAASFLVKVSYSPAANQGNLFGSPEQSIADVMTNLERLDREKFEDIRSFYIDSSRLSHENTMAYLRSFFSTALAFLPDGKVVESLGVGWRSHNHSRALKFSPKTNRIREWMRSLTPYAAGERKFYTGILLVADGKNNRVTIRLENGKTIRCQVENGLQDIVRRHFDDRVLVEVLENHSGRERVLIDIREVSTEE